MKAKPGMKVWTKSGGGPYIVVTVSLYDVGLVAKNGLWDGTAEASYYTREEGYFEVGYEKITTKPPMSPEDFSVTSPWDDE